MPLAVLSLVSKIRTFPLTIPWTGHAIDGLSLYSLSVLYLDDPLLSLYI